MANGLRRVHRNDQIHMSIISVAKGQGHWDKPGSQSVPRWNATRSSGFSPSSSCMFLGYRERSTALLVIAEKLFSKFNLVEESSEGLRPCSPSIIHTHNPKSAVLLKTVYMDRNTGFKMYGTYESSLQVIDAATSNPDLVFVDTYMVTKDQVPLNSQKPQVHLFDAPIPSSARACEESGVILRFGYYRLREEEPVGVVLIMGYKVLTELASKKKAMASRYVHLHMWGDLIWSPYAEAIMGACFQRLRAVSRHLVLGGDYKNEFVKLLFPSERSVLDRWASGFDEKNTDVVGSLPTFSQDQKHHYSTRVQFRARPKLPGPPTSAGGFTVASRRIRTRISETYTPSGSVLMETSASIFFLWVAIGLAKSCRFRWENSEVSASHGRVNFPSIWVALPERHERILSELVPRLVWLQPNNKPGQSLVRTSLKAGDCAYTTTKPAPGEKARGPGGITKS
ncbi:hypothetical protein IW262DRAFT_1300264 [Armillaria fumosa]|nr:hypothetical protein IW262DRAFT_1300264 [Armillaria fumosa]